MSLSDSIKSTLMTKYRLDQVSLNVISNAIEKNNIKLVEVDSDLYVKDAKRDNILQKLDITNGIPQISGWIKMLINIQTDRFSNNGITVDSIDNTGLLLHYLFEKINSLENEIKSLKSTTPTDDKLIEEPVSFEDGKIINQINKQKKEPFTFERIYEECMEISKEHNISVRLFDLGKQMSYYIHWSETLTDPIRTSVNEFKNAIAKDPKMKSNLGLLLFEKDNILIYANISTYKMTNEIKDRFTELFS